MTTKEFLIKKCKERALSEGGRILAFDEVVEIVEANRKIVNQSLKQMAAPVAFVSLGDPCNPASQHSSKRI